MGAHPEPARGVTKLAGHAGGSLYQLVIKNQAATDTFGNGGRDQVHLVLWMVVSFSAAC